MNYIRRIFRHLSGSSKSSRPDSLPNKIIKKIIFFGFVSFTTLSIISKNYKTSLIFTFQPNDFNKKLVDQNSVFHSGIYNPTYWMLYGPFYRFYAKYFEEPPYLRPISQPATKQFFQTHSIPIADNFSTKKNLPITLIVAGWGGLNIQIQKLMVSMNTGGFKTICLRPDDFHNQERLQKTIEKIKNENPQSKIYGIGIDYGANLLVKYAAKHQKTLNGLVSIANPLSLEESQKSVQNANFLWKKLLYNDMVKSRISTCQQNKKLFGQTLKLNPQTTSLYEIDRTCYNSQFDDYQALKERLSSLNYIKNLKVPSLFIQSQEDPCSISIETNEQKLQNSNCIFVESRRGGYTQWFESMQKTRWVNRPIVHFFRQLNTMS